MTDFLGREVVAGQYVVYSDGDTTRLTLGKIVSIDVDRKRGLRIKPLALNGYKVGDSAQVRNWVDQFKTPERVCIVSSLVGMRMALHSALIS